MDGHLHFFPTGFPDETLHSLISRYARLCGFRCSQAAFAGMKSAPAFSQNVALPSRLADLAGYGLGKAHSKAAAYGAR